ncbi:hypothetical protein GCM10027589_34550 [Actinocorallia lasiicapitis]
MSAAPQNPVAQHQVAPPETSLIESVWRFRLMSALIVLGTLGAVVLVTQVLFSGAAATGRFAVTDPTNKDYLQMGVVSGPSYATYTAQRATFAKSAPVLAKAAEHTEDELGGDYTTAELRAAITASAKPDSGVVVITAKARSVRVAATMVNGVILAYRELTAEAIRLRRDNQLKATQAAEKKLTAQLLALPVKSGREFLTINDALRRLQATEASLLTDSNRQDDGVQFVDEADPGAAAASKLPRNVAIGGAIGVLLACVVSFLRATTPTRGRKKKPQPQPAPVPSPVVFEHGPDYGDFAAAPAPETTFQPARTARAPWHDAAPAFDAEMTSRDLKPIRDDDEPPVRASKAKNSLFDDLSDDLSGDPLETLIERSTRPKASVGVDEADEADSAAEDD